MNPPNCCQVRGGHDTRCPSTCSMSAPPPPHTFLSRGRRSGTYQWLALPISHFVSWHKANFSLLPPLLPYTESIWLFPWYLCELISIHAHYQGMETWVMVVRTLSASGLGLLW